LNTKAFEGDFVFGSPQGMSTDDPRPANCSFKADSMCRFTVAGTYGLKTADAASIEVGAYEDGSAKALYATTLPNAKRGSSRWFVDDFPYRPSASAKEVAILVRLLDPSGKELARGNPTKYPVNGA
jgi:hypothetical protein